MTTHTHLSVAAPPTQPASFRERALAALETHQGADLVSFLAMHHEAEIAEVVEQAVSANHAVAQTAAAAAIDQQMLASIVDTVRPMLRQSGENAARASFFAGRVEAIRKLLHDAEAAGAIVDADQLRQLLDVAPAPAPFRPLVVGFVASSHYRVGHFRHIHTNVEWHLPFAGYSMCEESPERPMTVHVAFLHKGVVRPRPQLYAEYGLVMEHME
jgi:hypothetical protein